MNTLISNKKIYALVICYNAAPVLAETYKRIDKSLFDKIYLFEDASTDNSAEIAKQFDWIIVQNEKNLGHGGNLKKGLKMMFEDGADYAVEIHADGFWDNQSLDNSMVVDQTLIDDLKSVEGVDNIVQRLQTFSLISMGDKTKGGVINGININND